MNITRFNKFELEYDTNNNIIKITELSSENGTDYTTGDTRRYIYDNKNNPERLFLELANVNGDFIRFDPKVNNVLGTISFAGLVYIPKNNIISTTISDNNSSISQTLDITYDNEYPIIAESEITFNTTNTTILTWSYEGNF